MLDSALKTFLEWMGMHGVRILLILLVATLVYRAIQVVIGRARRIADTRSREARKQALTLLGVVQSATFVIVLVITTLMLLTEIGIDITPLIAGASIVGLAISLGAQTFFKDLIGGLFILVEDQFHYGDYVQVGTVSGEVEHISLRATYLRDHDGTLHIVPNGDIRVVSNRTSGFSRAIVDLTLPVQTDTRHVLAALEEVVRAANADPAMQTKLLEPLKVLALEALDTTTMRVRVRGKTVPGQQWLVSRTLRLQIKERLDAEGITITHLQDASTQSAAPDV